MSDDPTISDELVKSNEPAKSGDDPAMSDELVKSKEPARSDDELAYYDPSHPKRQAKYLIWAPDGVQPRDIRHSARSKGSR